MICIFLVPQYRQIQQIAQRLRIIGDELDADERIRRFGLVFFILEQTFEWIFFLFSMVEQVPIHSPYETFSDVAKELFCDGIYNWGRIVTLFYFTYKLLLKVGQFRMMKMIYISFLVDERSSLINFQCSDRMDRSIRSRNRRTLDC